MKKAIIGIAVGFVLIGLFFYVNKLFYPAVPIENISRKELLDKIENTNEKIVEVTTEGNYIWYIIDTENEGMYTADKIIQDMIGSKGWTFEGKEGAGLFFEKENEKLVVTTQVWTKKYVLAKVESKFSSL